MGDRYFFDKRVIKRALIKYGIMFAIGLPVLVVLNLYALNGMTFWAATAIDAAVLLAIVGACSLVYYKIERQRIRKAEEEAKRQKELAKAQRKAKKMAKKQKQAKVQHKVENVEIITPDNEE